MSGPLFRASSTARVRQCVGSAVLPVVGEPDSYDAARGVALHAFLKRAAEVGRDLALAEVPLELRDFASVLDLSDLPVAAPQSFSFEVRLAYSPATEVGRFMVDDSDAPTAHEIAGQVDALGVTDTAVVVWDYKFGARMQDRPEAHDQLKTYAVMAAAALERTSAVVGWIRFTAAGEPVRMTAVLDEAALKEHAAVLSALAYEVMTERELVQHTPHLVRVTEGDECSWCPSFERCPAKMNAIRSLGGESPEVLQRLLDAMTPEQAAGLFQRWHNAQRVMRMIEDRLRDFVKVSGRPLKLDDGRVWGPKAMTETTFDATKAKVVLANLFDAKVADDAVEQPPPRMSKAGLQRALRSYWLAKNAGRIRGVGKLEQQALAELSQAGASTATTTFEYRIYTPKPPTADEQLADGLKSNIAALKETTDGEEED